MANISPKSQHEKQATAIMKRRNKGSNNEKPASTAKPTPEPAVDDNDNHNEPYKGVNKKALRKLLVDAGIEHTTKDNRDALIALLTK